MNVYIYSKSGHSVGLDGTKKCSAIFNTLKKYNPILCTSDFRAGVFAKEHLGVTKYINIDVIRNLPNLMERKDILLYDTNEVNDEMKNDMKEFCSLVYDLNSDLNEIIIDKNIYEKIDKVNLEKTIFFGDDDYNNIFLNMLNNSKKYNMNILTGHYFFLGNQKYFKEHFSNVIDEEEYVNTVQNSKFLLTGSLQSALESISCGNKPVILMRVDKEYNINLINRLNIPIIKKDNLDDIINTFNFIIKDYPKLEEYKEDKNSKILNEIENTLLKYNRINNN